MKSNILLLLGALAGLCATSCFKSEALNAEADIVACTLDGDLLSRDPEIKNNKVTLMLKKGSDLTALAPQFTLTPGATISPASGTVHDFTFPQTYTVTSEDREWSKEYTVEATTSAFSATHYSFENVKMDVTNRFQVFYEASDDASMNFEWSSGNPGFALACTTDTWRGYPTYQSEGNEGYRDHCLILTTHLTGSFGSMVGMPLAAGSLFLGTFDVNYALKEPLKATRFGVPFEQIPTQISGWYKYRSGEIFQSIDSKGKLQPVPGKRDECHIYAIFYESTEDMPMVDGENALKEDNPNVVSVARFVSTKDVDTWTKFTATFETRPGKTVDLEKLAEGKYNLGIVFTSSIEGDLFQGAPDSTLWVDEVELEYKENE